MPKKYKGSMAITRVTGYFIIIGSNIFLTSSGLLKLGDFGSAIRLLDRSRTMPGEISSHSGITASFTAPEVVNSADRKGYGRAADVWSIGCVVIEMATGKVLTDVTIIFLAAGGSSYIRVF